MSVRPPEGPGARPSEGRGSRLQILLVGVGGQGVLTSARILGAAAHAAGHPVVVGQLHGMSQRGGSVECTVLVGPGESSFLLGSADVIVAFEPLELLRALPKVGPQTRIVTNDGTITPYALTRDGVDYPDIEELVARVDASAAEVIRVDGPSLVTEVGEPRTLNFTMLGALVGLGVLPFDGAAFWDAAEQQLPPRYLGPNRKAFDLGWQWVEKRRASKQRVETGSVQTPRGSDG